MIMKLVDDSIADYVVLGHGIPIGRVTKEQLKALRTKSRTPDRVFKMIARLISQVASKGIVIGTCVSMLDTLWMTVDPAGYVSFIVSAGFIPFDRSSQKSLALAPFAFGFLWAAFAEGVSMVKNRDVYCSNDIAKEFGCQMVTLLPNDGIQISTHR